MISKIRTLYIAGCLALLSSTALHGEDLLAPLKGGDWTINAGFGSSKLYNIVGIVKELPLEGKWRWYIGAGLGDILVGGGVSWFSDRENDGLFLSLNAGLIGAYLNGGYQFKVGKQSHLVFGLSAGTEGRFVSKSLGLLRPVVAFEYHL